MSKGIDSSSYSSKRFIHSSDSFCSLMALLKVKTSQIVETVAKKPMIVQVHHQLLLLEICSIKLIKNSADKRIVLNLAFFSVCFIIIPNWLTDSICFSWLWRNSTSKVARQDVYRNTKAKPHWDLPCHFCWCGAILCLTLSIRSDLLGRKLVHCNLMG